MPPLEVNLFNYFAIEMAGDFYVVGEHRANPQEAGLEVSIFRFNLMNQQWRRMTSFLGQSVTSMARLAGQIYFTFADFSAQAYDPGDNTWRAVI